MVVTLKGYLQMNKRFGINIFTVPGDGSDETKDKEPPKKVLPFDADNILPEVLKPFVNSLSKSMLCPPDFIGVGIIPMLCSLIGSKAAIQPGKRQFLANISSSVGHVGSRAEPA